MTFSRDAVRYEISDSARSPWRRGHSVVFRCCVTSKLAPLMSPMIHVLIQTHCTELDNYAASAQTSLSLWKDVVNGNFWCVEQGHVTLGIFKIYHFAVSTRKHLCLY